MSEILSKQQTLIAAGKHLINAGDAGRDRVQVMVAPAAYAALNVGDTMGTGQLIPRGSRLAQATLSVGAGGAGQQFNVGIRDWVTKVPIDATAIGNAIAVNAAGVFTANNGTKITGGIDYLTPQDCEAYITNAGAAGVANQPVLMRVTYIGA